ncbi:MAG: CvpA family protein [Xanthomonadales bacterium]|nr:CvpA family protein [Xanthomonadales bacterium]
MNTLLNWADYVILGVLGVSILVGILRGFIREVMSIAVWTAAITLAYMGVAPGAELLTHAVDVPSMRVVIAFAAIFLVVLVVGGLLTWLMGRLIATTGLAPTDRMVGMVFGLARGVAIVGIAVLLARFTPFPQDPWWQESKLLPHFERVAETAESWLPQPVRQYLPSEGVEAGVLVNES